MSTQESLSRLENNVKAMSTRNRSRMTRMIIIQVIFLVFIVGYLTWAHSMIAKLTPDDIVLRLQQEAVEQMPTLSRQLVDQLNGYAPELMKTAQQKVLSLIPMASKKIEMELDQTLFQVTAIIKEKLGDAEAILKAEKQNLDLKMPNLPDKESIDQLLANVRANFRANAVAAAQSIKDDYGNRMKEINLQLEHLTLDDKALTEKELLQKRLLEVWIKIIKLKTDGNLIK